jgi:hypothetical protein
MPLFAIARYFKTLVGTQNSTHIKKNDPKNTLKIATIPASRLQPSLPHIYHLCFMQDAPLMVSNLAVKAKLNKALLFILLCLPVQAMVKCR